MDRCCYRFHGVSGGKSCNYPGTMGTDGTTSLFVIHWIICCLIRFEMTDGEASY